MTMLAKSLSDHRDPEPDAGLSLAAALLHGLSDPSRLAILQHLSLGEHRVRDLTEHLGLAQSTVSAHLACLRDCGLVVSRPQGRASMFSLTSVPELLGVLDAAERLLASSGYAVALCPNYGVGTDDVAPDERTRLLAARLLADGGWLAEAANVSPPTPGDLAQLRAFAHNLVKD